ncbi:hypothetical protein L1887_48434 [Cichorium endivia]|nr:hypothetical protein L1887_48434 [Cichorium endivia]
MARLMTHFQSAVALLLVCWDAQSLRASLHRRLVGRVGAAARSGQVDVQADPGKRRRSARRAVLGATTSAPTSTPSSAIPQHRRVSVTVTIDKPCSTHTDPLHWIERQSEARQGKARQGKARQGKARQGKARQGKASILDMALSTVLRQANMASPDRLDSTWHSSGRPDRKIEVAQRSRLHGPMRRRCASTGLAKLGSDGEGRQRHIAVSSRRSTRPDSIRLDSTLHPRTTRALADATRLSTLG